MLSVSRLFKGIYYIHKLANEDCLQNELHLFLKTSVVSSAICSTENPDLSNSGLNTIKLLLLAVKIFSLPQVITNAKCNYFSFNAEMLGYSDS